MKLRGLPVTPAAVLAAAPAAAHRSFAVRFVADKLVTVHGKVDELTFRTPHGVLLLTADGEGGAQQRKIATSSPNILRPL